MQYIHRCTRCETGWLATKSSPVARAGRSGLSLEPLPVRLAVWRAARRAGGSRRPARQCPRRHRPGRPTHRSGRQGPANGRDFHAPGPVAGRPRERGAEVSPGACKQHGWCLVLGAISQCQTTPPQRRLAEPARAWPPVPPLLAAAKIPLMDVRRSVERLDRTSIARPRSWYHHRRRGRCNFAGCITRALREAARAILGTQRRTCAPSCYAGPRAVSSTAMHIIGHSQKPRERTIPAHDPKHILEERSARCYTSSTSAYSTLIVREKAQCRCPPRPRVAGQICA